MRLTLVIGALRCGGAERVLTSLANGWRREGHAVTVVTFCDGSEPPYFPLDPDVLLAPLGVANPSLRVVEAVTNNVTRVRALRAAFRQHRPDVVVSFLTAVNVLALVAAAGRAIPVVVSERVHPGLDPLPRVWRWLRAGLYERAGAVVVQTQRTAEWFPRRMRSRIVVIPNAVARSATGGSRQAGRGFHRTLLGVGRLNRQKGFDLLVRAFAEAARHRHDWNLTIAGDGPERETLEALAASSGVADRVHLIGRQSDIRRTFAEAAVFALPSRWEGFPNALLEAMAAGLPVVAADCPTGPREIIRDERDGLLVKIEDVESLARALARLIDDVDLRQRLGAEAARSVDRYDPEAIQQRWNALVADVADRAQRRA